MPLSTDVLKSLITKLKDLYAGMPDDDAHKKDIEWNIKNLEGKVKEKE